MTLLARLGVVLYVGVVWVFLLLVLFTLSGDDRFYQVFISLMRLYHDDYARLIMVTVASVLLFLNHVLMKIILGGGKEAIGFNNPSGRVTISLTALQDLARRVILRIPEVKEERTSVLYRRRRGLEISSRLILNADVNIPEMTHHLQELVKRKIQDIIGLEENVIVRVDVDKINLRPRSAQPSEREHKEDVQEGSFPFHGYRA